MRGSILRDLFILVAFGASIFMGVYYLVRNVSLTRPDFTYDFSVEQEEQLGDLMKDGIWSNLPALHNHDTDSALTVITERLLAAVDSTPYHYRFRIIRNEQINAFTIPGGNIYLFSGLIEVSDSPEEIAAVLAHEIGHAEKRHVVKKIVKEFSIAAIASVITGGDPGLMVQVIELVLGSSFDREQEDEADQYALELLEKSGIDPRHLADFFEKLNEEDLSYNPNLEILMTHPHNDRRIDKARSYRTSRDFKETKLDLDWKKVKEAAE